MTGKIRSTLALLAVFALTSCSFNPFTTDNHLTGSALPTAIGAGAGVGAAALLGASKPAPLIAGGVVGGAIGYYVSTLRFAAGGVVQSGGQVFTLGEYASIEVPTDKLFESNSADFLDDADPILDSVVAIIKRYPDSNIIVSGNTSGFGVAKYERKLSQDRARQVAAYLWAHGVSEWKYQSLKRRHLTYVGYGNYFPIANDVHNNSLRKNSRIQITIYPSADQLKIEKKAFENMGGLDEPPLDIETQKCANLDAQLSSAFREEGKSQRSDYKGTYAEGGGIRYSVSSTPARHADYYHEGG